MSCVLRIDGNKFDVDGFIKQTNLKPYKVFKKGEIDTSIKRKRMIHKSSGCYLDISKADFDNFEAQTKDAIKFLKRYMHSLKKIKEYGKADCVLDFGTNTRMGNAEIQVDYFPKELLLLAGNLNIGIEFSQYHPYKEEVKRRKKRALAPGANKSGE